MFNAEQGARLGVEHLLSLGHERIALLSGPESSVSARARLAGWNATLAQAGLEAVAVAHGDWSAASGYEKGHLLLSAAQLPDAIVVANDQMGAGGDARLCGKRDRDPGADVGCRVRRYGRQRLVFSPTDHHSPGFSRGRRAKRGVAAGAS